MKYFKPIIFIHVLYVVVLFSACDDRLNIENNPNITRVFLVGNALRGWTDYDKSPLAEPMLRTGDTVFQYKGNLSTGFLKINCDEIPDWDGNWFLPSKTDTVLNTGNKIKMSFSPDGDGGETGPKWQITESAQYIITLDKAAGTILCERTGDYIPIGTADFFSDMWLIVCLQYEPWSEPMIKTGDNWSITTDLKNGHYVKFYGESIKRTDWDTPYSLKWFCPLEDSEPALDGLFNTGTRMFKYGADNAFAWSINSDGVYTITLNPVTGMIDFKKN